ncbi:MAG TPA: GNAT family N-acetyltransferase [Acidimicrobiia bacterium]|jgi:RimJ/RimL family protein N-acetyltransferase|nr:GNAT family N-acetyltransferase [Acidimicrobiia bacterium]
MTNNMTTMSVGDRVLTVREITLADVDRLHRMFTRLSPDTVYRRFFSPINEPRRSALVWLAAVDHGSREALVAVDGDEIVAVARYDSRPGSSAAEIAVTVEDAWQHQGIGGQLTKRLARRAVDHGIESFVATVLADNRPALGLMHKLAPDASVRFDGGGYEASMPLQHSSRS